jgi:nucleoside-diphosphate-sugar epimerase
LTLIDAEGPELVEQIAAFDPDVVIHLATHFLASHEVSDIPALMRSNIEFGTFVLEGAAHCSARVLNVNSAWQHVDGAPYAPVSLYAATKQAFSDIASYFSQVRELEIRDVTLFDSYGPSDTRMKLVPLLLAAARSGASLDMSDGQQLIDLTYVDDVAAGVIHAALSSDAPVSSVIRSWKPMTVREVVERVEAVTGSSINVNWGVRPARPREMRTDWIFGSALPGWQPEVSFDDGIFRCWGPAVSSSAAAPAATDDEGQKS